MSNPAEKLQAAFQHIADTRMAGLPILNPELRVEAVGFSAWQGRWVGALVTPWTISLAVLPGESMLEKLLLDEKAVWAFPSGKYEFMGIDEPGLGVCHLCSLISPVHEFAAHADAVAVAMAAITKLMQLPAESEQAEDVRRMAEMARLEGQSITQQPLTRRDFMRGSFMGG